MNRQNMNLEASDLTRFVSRVLNVDCRLLRETVDSGEVACEL